MVAGNEDAKRPGAIVPFTLKSSSNSFELAPALSMMAAALAFIVRIRYLSWLSLYLAIIGIVSQKTSSSSNAWQGLMFALTSLSTLYLPILMDMPNPV